MTIPYFSYQISLFSFLATLLLMLIFAWLYPVNCTDTIRGLVLKSKVDILRTTIKSLKFDSRITWKREKKGKSIESKIYED
jgi:hypothetical protein